MRAELDISLENPIQRIDLESICTRLSDTYALIRHMPNHYLVLANQSKDSTLRIHEDGRVYVKMEFDPADSKDSVFKKLIGEMNTFLKSTCHIKDLSFQRELNFSFYGPLAHSYYWKKQAELNNIGMHEFDNFNMRTFAFDEDSILIKLEAANVVTA